jgi:hypothetical protein
MADQSEIAEDLQLGGWLARRQSRRKTHRILVAREADRLLEQYGAAAQSIARGSSYQIVGFERRRFWRDVATELARRAEAGALKSKLRGLDPRHSQGSGEPILPAVSTIQSR